MKPTTPIKRGRQKIQWVSAPPPPSVVAAAGTSVYWPGRTVLIPVERPPLSGGLITRLYG